MANLHIRKNFSLHGTGDDRFVVTKHFDHIKMLDEEDINLIIIQGPHFEPEAQAYIDALDLDTIIRQEGASPLTLGRCEKEKWDFCEAEAYLPDSPARTLMTDRLKHVTEIFFNYALKKFGGDGGGSLAAVHTNNDEEAHIDMTGYQLVWIFKGRGTYRFKSAGKDPYADPKFNDVFPTGKMIRTGNIAIMKASHFKNPRIHSAPTEMITSAARMRSVLDVTF